MGLFLDDILMQKFAQTVSGRKGLRQEDMPPLISTVGLNVVNFPATIPSRADITDIKLSAQGVGTGTTTIYTVPAGKVAYIYCVLVSGNVAGQSHTVNIITKAGVTLVKQSFTGIGNHDFLPSLAVKLVEGDTIQTVVGATGSLDYSVLGWEEAA